MSARRLIEFVAELKAMEEGYGMYVVVVMGAIGILGNAL